MTDADRQMLREVHEMLAELTGRGSSVGTEIVSICGSNDILAAIRDRNQRIRRRSK